MRTDKEFTQWWHPNCLDMWKRWIPKNVKNALEVGSFEGMSAIWLLDYLPGSKITCVDTFSAGFDDITGEYEERFDRNMKEYGDRVKKVKGKSQEVLKTFDRRKKYDLVYIDAHHEYESVKADLKLCWALLKKGGLMILDDYNNEGFGVRQAVDEFLESVDAEVLRLPEDYQMAFTKK